MKKIILLTAGMLGCFVMAMAQGNPSFHVGIKGGANINKIDGKGYDESFRFNYHLGGFAQFNFSDNIGLQPEVIFSQSSAKTSDNFSSIYTGFSDDANRKNIKLNYLSIPLLLNLGSRDVKFQVGPQYSILLNKNDNIIENGKNAFKSGDFAAVGGIWVQLPVVPINLSARYIIGLGDVNDLPNSDKWKNQSIQLGVGFTF
jgi:hypothetical protein